MRRGSIPHGHGTEAIESIGTPAGGLLESVDSAGPGKAHPVGTHC